MAGATTTKKNTHNHIEHISQSNDFNNYTYLLSSCTLMYIRQRGDIATSPVFNSQWCCHFACHGAPLFSGCFGSSTFPFSRWHPFLCLRWHSLFINYRGIYQRYRQFLLLIVLLRSLWSSSFNISLRQLHYHHYKNSNKNYDYVQIPLRCTYRSVNVMPESQPEDTDNDQRRAGFHEIRL